MRRLSIKEIAQLAGTSKSTVSRYLNQPDMVKGATAERIAQVIEETGFSPNVLARNFRRGNTRLIIVVIPSVGYPLFDEAMRGAWRVAQEKGYNVLILTTQQITEPPAHYFSKIISSKQADGLLLFSASLPHQDGVAYADQFKLIPIVVGFEFTDAELQCFPSVHIDNTAAVRQVMEYLIGLGHEEVAFLGGQTDVYSICGRELAFRDSLKSAGLAIRDEWIIQCQTTSEDARTNFSRLLDLSRSNARQLLNLSHRPTAIFCGGGDIMALGAIHEIKAAGLRVPQDISVIGFDDIHYADISDPPLTTVSQPAEEIGERSMYRLCAMIEGTPEESTPWIIPHRLIVRESVSPPQEHLYRSKVSSQDHPEDTSLSMEQAK